MIGLVWVAGALIAGVAAWAAGWPAWRSYRAREFRDLNAERYFAWRGRASRGQSASMSEGLTAAERRRLFVAAALAAVAVVCLAVFFAVT